MRYKRWTDEMSRYHVLYLFTASLFVATEAGAQAQQTTSNEDTAATSVEVVGVKDPDWKPYMTMLAGADVFEKKHDIAPNAALLFRLQPQQSGVTLTDVALRLTDGATSYPLPVASDGTFSLPRVSAVMKEETVLELNRKKTQVRWRPYIVTPGTGANTRRLGDLRLECEVRWAIESSGFSFFKRNLINALGGPCRTGRVTTYYFADRVLASATIREGQKSQAVYIQRSTSAYVPPIADESWGNDAVVEFNYL
jgi:hypothetical protein